MELFNATKMTAGYTMGMKPSGREWLVVVVKGTYSIPNHPEQPTQLAAKQSPLIEVDTFSGVPGFSATVYESDYAPVKPRCDVLLSGSAYAPRNMAATRVRVSLSVGPLKKSFDVVGNRVWRKGAVGISWTAPEPFTVMPISYDCAFGGIDSSHADPKRHSAFRQNPAGVGYHVNTAGTAIHGKPLPNTEEQGKPVIDFQGQYRPMAFGPVGRAWLPRASFAGTYDDKWFATQFPFLPDDFDERYYQAAPIDQQMEYPRGGEEVELLNLTPDGQLRFRLPSLDLPVEFIRDGSASVSAAACVDTIWLEPDQNRFSLTWRASIPLRRNVFEVPRCVIGTMPRGWYRARALGKTYYPSLRHLVADRS